MERTVSPTPILALHVTQKSTSRTSLPLAPMLLKLRGIIGFDAMLTLAAARGGERIWIPASLPDGHWLIDTIGHELATKLAQHFALPGSAKRELGMRIELPLLPKELRVCHLTKEGKSSNEIARALLMSVRTVGHHRRRLREAELL